MEEDRRRFRFGLVSLILAEDAGLFCGELALNIVALINFAISDSVKDSVSLCILILELEHHSP